MPKLTSANIHPQDIKTIERLVSAIPGLTMKQFVRTAVVEYTSAVLKQMQAESARKQLEAKNASGESREINPSAESAAGTESSANTGEGIGSDIASGAAQDFGSAALAVSESQVGTV